MPLLRINATDTGLQLHCGSTGVTQAVHAAGAATGPAIIMVHGYKYAPHLTNHCPHAKIFNNHGTGWPGALGFTDQGVDEGLGIAFGWYARGPLWQVHRRAAKSGRALAGLVETLRRAAPERPVHIIAHSMGSEIALSALAYLPPHAIGRMVLLTGASFVSHAREMLRSPAGRTTEVFNITSRENDLFDMFFEHMVPAPALRDGAIGRGIDLPNATTLQLDCHGTLSVFEDLGLAIAAPQRRVCHWSSYRRPGVMALYARLLRDPASLPQAHLATLLPQITAPRWSRLLRPRPFATPVTTTAYGLAAAAQAFGAKAGFLTPEPSGSKDKEPAF